MSTSKEDTADFVKERVHSISSDYHSSISPDSTSLSFNDVQFTLQYDTPSVTTEKKESSPDYVSNTESLGSVAFVTSVSASIGMSHSEATCRHSIDQLALNMGFGGIKPSVTNQHNPSSVSTSSSTSLVNSQSQRNVPSLTSEQHCENNEHKSLNQETSSEHADTRKQCFITQIDPVEMVAKPILVTVSKDVTRRASMLLSGSKFRLNMNKIRKEKSSIHSNSIYFNAIVFVAIAFIFTLWKPISSYFSGLIVGMLFAATLFYMWIRIFINMKIDKNDIEEWVDFPALESLLDKCDKEDKNTDIKVTGASIAFQCYEADNDDDFIRYPCEIRLEGYRLIIQLASKLWDEDKKSEKEVKFIGYREYLVKEAQIILVPEETLTRTKYWMNEYPIVLQNLQILDKQIFNKQELEKSKMDTNEFFTNTATTLSIWFETSPQKEEWFHKLSLILLIGKEDIERFNNLTTQSNSFVSSTISSSTLSQSLTQTDSDSKLVSDTIEEPDVSEVLLKMQTSVEELQEKAKMVQLEHDDIDASGTHRTIAKKSKKNKTNEVNLKEVLLSPECLDETAITINFITRRLLCDMFDIPLFKDLIKTKVEMKLKEIAVSILENLRVASIDLGNRFPLILKVEPMQWNTQGIWFNLFLYYRGNFKLSIKTHVLLQKLINYNPKTDDPIFAQHHTTQCVYKDDEHIDDEDLIQRQKLLAKEPEMPEMAVTRKLGLALTKLASNKYFQIFANIPLIKKLFEKFSEEELGIDIEVTSFSGVLTLNIPPPPSDRIWIGFPEVPGIKIKVTPTYGVKTYSYRLLEDFLTSKIRTELKRLVVLPAMDDQLLPFFRDWVIDVIGEIASKPVNPLTDNYKAKLNAQATVRVKLQEYKEINDLENEISTISMSTESS